MGSRQATLRNILANDKRISVPRPSLEDLKRVGLLEEVTNVYRSLGGQQSPPRVRPGAWDVSLHDYSVELDEERHFNRYRGITCLLALPANQSFRSGALHDVLQGPRSRLLESGELARQLDVALGREGVRKLFAPGRPEGRWLCALETARLLRLHQRSIAANDRSCTSSHLNLGRTADPHRYGHVRFRAQASGNDARPDVGSSDSRRSGYAAPRPHVTPRANDRT
jgi:hypothetical protein